MGLAQSEGATTSHIPQSATLVPTLHHTIHTHTHLAASSASWPLIPVASSPDSPPAADASALPSDWEAPLLLAAEERREACRVPVFEKAFVAQQRGGWRGNHFPSLPLPHCHPPHTHTAYTHVPSSPPRLARSAAFRFAIAKAEDGSKRKGRAPSRCCCPALAAAAVLAAPSCVARRIERERACVRVIGGLGNETEAEQPRTLTPQTRTHLLPLRQ